MSLLSNWTAYNAGLSETTTIISKDSSLKLFVKDLTVIDASYLCAQRGMVGESWILDVVMSGELNEMSMVLDFSRVKIQIKQLVDQFIDHRLIVPRSSSNMRIFSSEITDYSRVDLTSDEQFLQLNCPDEAFCFIDSETVTLESVTDYVQALLLKHLPSNVSGLEITLRPENIVGAFYHYSHGLKKHDGNCQRIAHGHRSPIEIMINGERNASIEHAWAERWTDIYLGSSEDVCAVSALSFSADACVSEESHWGFCYQAPQGMFELIIPKARVEMLDTDTTVELLAEYIATQIKEQHNEAQVCVVAYEGVGKGALFDC